MKPQSPFWSINLCQVRGTSFRLHISLVLAALWVLFEGWSQQGLFSQYAFFLVLALISLALHEAAQTAAALSLKVRIKEVVFYPYGGVAHYHSEAAPRNSILIAFAGIIMSALIAVGCFSAWDTTTLPGPTKELLYHLFILNSALAAINILPVSSLDGGKIFRALLAASGRIDRSRISSLVSVISAALLCATTFFFGGFAPSALAAFILIEAFQEHLYQKTRPLTETFTATDVTIPLEELAIFTHGMTVEQAYRKVLRSFQTVFPVAHGTDIVGVVDREVIVQQVAVDPGVFITGLVIKDLPRITPTTPLREVFDLVQTEDPPCLLVLDGSKLTGLLFKDRLMEFLFVQGLRRKIAASEDPLDRF